MELSQATAVEALRRQLPSNARARHSRECAGHGSSGRYSPPAPWRRSAYRPGPDEMLRGESTPRPRPAAAAAQLIGPGLIRLLQSTEPMADAEQCGRAMPEV